jgi:hypothetical protein
MKLFDFPLATFTPENLQETMAQAKDGTLFCIKVSEIKHHEGDSDVEVVWAKIFRTTDVSGKP